MTRKPRLRMMTLLPMTQLRGPSPAFWQQVLSWVPCHCGLMMPPCPRSWSSPPSTPSRYLEEQIGREKPARCREEGSFRDGISENISGEGSHHRSLASPRVAGTQLVPRGGSGWGSGRCRLYLLVSGRWCLSGCIILSSGTVCQLLVYLHLATERSLSFDFSIVCLIGASRPRKLSSGASRRSTACHSATPPLENMVPYKQAQGLFGHVYPGNPGFMVASCAKQWLEYLAGSAHTHTVYMYKSLWDSACQWLLVPNFIRLLWIPFYDALFLGCSFPIREMIKAMGRERSILSPAVLTHGLQE